MKKRGYFFTLDAFLAISVIIVGLIVLFSFQSTLTSEKQALFFSEGISSIFSTIHIYELNNPYINENIQNKNITNTEYTILEQIGELYYRNQSYNCEYCLSIAGNLTRNITWGLLSDGFDFALVFENQTLYQSSTNLDSAEIVVSSKQLVFGVYNATEVWGPYRSEVLVWRI